MDHGREVGGGEGRGEPGGEGDAYIPARGIGEGGRRGLREEKEDGGEEAEYPEVETGHTIGIPVYRCVGVRLCPLRH